VAYGVPSIEICRFAEECRADLIVVGRKEPWERSRPLLGDTADAVARRSRIPTLFVPETGTRLRRVLVALDGSERGMSVLEQACSFGRAVGASLDVITVEGSPASEPDGGSVPLTRSMAIQAQVSATMARENLPKVALIVRRGNIAAEVLKEVDAGDYDVLVIGHHRGGPGWLVQTRSTAQQLGHAAPCAVLTVPL
jgi:nucleotide-binding universal stress UspA family protein